MEHIWALIDNSDRVQATILTEDEKVVEIQTEHKLAGMTTIKDLEGFASLKNWKLSCVA